MARFLGMVKLAPDGAKRMLDVGPVARREHFERAAAQVGGCVEQMWLTNVGDWDLLMLVDVPGNGPAGGAVATLARTATGEHASERWIELIDLDDVALALAEVTG